MNKVVLNKSYGGFRIPEAVAKIIATRKAWKGDIDRIVWGTHIDRHDPIVIAAIEEAKARNDWEPETARKLIELEIYELDEDKYFILEYDGYECVLTPETINWRTIK